MYSGVTGKLILSRSEITQSTPMVAYISNWSIEESTDIVEVAQLGNGFKEKIPCLQNWSASADGAVEFSQVNGKDSCQAELFAAKHGRAKVYCDFYLKDNVKLSGEAFIESLSIDLSAEDKGNISISISGIGALNLNC